MSHLRKVLLPIAQGRTGSTAYLSFSASSILRQLEAAEQALLERRAQLVQAAQALQATLELLDRLAERAAQEQQAEQDRQGPRD